MPPKILVISGPTASGKTRLAVELALRHGGEVVSADSMQVYRDLVIGTARPTQEEMAGVPHHMIAVAEPSEQWSAAEYVAKATPIVDDILSRGKLYTGNKLPRLSETNNKYHQSNRSKHTSSTR